jgi:phenylalanyl-tRNA synthetase beta chain
MKISRNWLQSYFKDPLPNNEAIYDALTFHVFEVDGIEAVNGDSIFDVKVTANRGHDCLSHRGIAKELSAILDISMTRDPLRYKSDLSPVAGNVVVSIEDPALCNRFTAAYIRGVNVGPSPLWLRERLEAIGQRSINNIVDATNYVMFDLGQPLHAFDAGKLASSEERFKLTVRKAREGERMLGLDDKEYSLSPAIVVIADANSVDQPVSIAGIKGGKPTGIDETTTDIILEAANWNGATIRKTSQALKLRTDASSRFEQVISAELAPYGLEAAMQLIQEIAGGEVVGFVDEYPIEAQKMSVSVSISRINAVLGSSLKDADVIDAFRRLGFSSIQEGEVFTVHVPFEHLDITISEDLIEEVGRIIGYDKIPNTELPSLANPPSINANFYAAEKIREELLSQGYSEVFTSVFADKGERVIANKVDGVRPYLRGNLIDGLSDALKRNIPNKDLLGLKEIKLFEIGTIWHKDSEEIVVATISEREAAKQWLLEAISDASAYENFPLSSSVRYKPFSKYPFIVRDVAMWMPVGNSSADMQKIIDTIFEIGGELVTEVSLLDVFEKADRKSVAYRIIFQSFEKTLTDLEVNAIMENVSVALRAKGFEIR